MAFLCRFWPIYFHFFHLFMCAFAFVQSFSVSFHCATNVSRWWDRCRYGIELAVLVEIRMHLKERHFVIHHLIRQKYISFRFYSSLRGNDARSQHTHAAVAGSRLCRLKWHRGAFIRILFAFRHLLNRLLSLTRICTFCLSHTLRGADACHGNHFPNDFLKR